MSAFPPSTPDISPPRRSTVYNRWLETGILAAAKLVQSVCRNSGRVSKLVRQNGFPKLWVDPKNHVGGMQRAFDIRDAHLVLLKIIGEITGPDALIPYYTKTFASDGAIGEMDFRARAVHPDAAEPGSLQYNCSIASPVFRIVILSPDGETDGGRTLPFPLPEKFIQFRGSKRTQGAWSYCAFDV